MCIFHFWSSNREFVNQVKGSYKLFGRRGILPGVTELSRGGGGERLAQLLRCSKGYSTERSGREGGGTIPGRGEAGREERVVNPVLRLSGEREGEGE